jgi:hypothetical protein
MDKKSRSRSFCNLVRSFSKRRVVTLRKKLLADLKSQISN